MPSNLLILPTILLFRQFNHFDVPVSQSREKDELDSHYRRDFITCDNQLLNGEMFLQVCSLPLSISNSSCAFFSLRLSSIAAMIANCHIRSLLCKLSYYIANCPCKFCRIKGSLIWFLSCWLQALNGFLMILDCQGELFFATHSIETYLGFHQVRKNFIMCNKKHKMTKIVNGAGEGGESLVKLSVTETLQTKWFNFFRL